MDISIEKTGQRLEIDRADHGGAAVPAHAQFYSVT
jgi:hypothetical protein